MLTSGSGKKQGSPGLGVAAPLMHSPQVEHVVATATPSNSRERPRPPVSESADSRATSLGMPDTSTSPAPPKSLDKLLFGAVYSLTRGSRQGASSDAMYEVSQLVSMASQLRVANPKTAAGAQRELQERCQRLVTRLPTMPSDPCSSGSEDVHSQAGPSEPSSLQSLCPGSQEAAASRLSLDSRLSTRVVLPRLQPPPQPSVAPSSQQSSRRSSRRPSTVNPFDLARSEDGMSVEVIEEDEMEFLVEEVTTPGGTVREVVVHESSSEIVQAAASPPPVLKVRARSEEMLEAALEAAVDEAAGEQLEFRVASVNDGGDAAAAAPNPFAAARATDSVSAADIVQPLPVKRRQGSLGMAREDLLSRVGEAPDLASAAQGTVFLDPLGSADSSGAAAQGSSAAAPEAAIGLGATVLQEEGKRPSRDSRRSSGDLAAAPRDKRREGSGDTPRKTSRAGSSQAETGASPISEVADKIKKRSTERNMQAESRKDKGKQVEAERKLKPRSSSSGKQLQQGSAAPAPIQSLRISHNHGEFNPFKNQKGWKIDFCCCPTTAHMELGGINSLTYPTFYEAAEQLSQQATARPGAADGRLRNDPLRPADSGASAIDNEFLSLASGPGGTMYSEFFPRRVQQEVLSPSATALPAMRTPGITSSASLGAAPSSAPSQALSREQSASLKGNASEADEDKAQGCGCWPFGR